MKPFQVLGNWDIPRHLLNPDFKLLSELHSTLPLGYVYSDPSDNRSKIYGGSDRWHTDGTGKPAGLIVWTNVYPTEVLLSDGSIVASKPNDIVLIDNRRVKHRIPLGYINMIRSGRETEDRYFLRYWLGDYPTDRQIIKWSQELRNKRNGIITNAANHNSW